MIDVIDVVIGRYPRRRRRWRRRWWWWGSGEHGARHLARAHGVEGTRNGGVLGLCGREGHQQQQQHQTTRRCRWPRCSAHCRFELHRHVHLHSEKLIIPCTISVVCVFVCGSANLWADKRSFVSINDWIVTKKKLF